jgi:NitT/TauT family transport system substrate-binding protein
MRKTFVCALALVAAAAWIPGADAQSLKVVIPQKGNWDTSIVDFGIKQGFFKEQGLDVEEIFTQGGASTEQAVISGSADFAMATGTLGIISAYVKGAPIRIISAEATGVPDIFWYATTASGIKTLKDTHGKTVAYSAPGSSSNLVLLGLLKMNGVDDAKPTATGGIPGTLTQVMSGQIDVGWSVPPFGFAEIKDGKLLVVAHGNDLPSVRDQTVRVNIVRLDLLQQNRAVVVKFAKAYDKSLNWAYSDPKAIDYYAAGLNVTRDVAAAAFKYYPRSSMQPYQIKGLQTTLDSALDAKRIDQPMKPDDIKGLIDIVWKPGQP